MNNYNVPDSLICIDYDHSDKRCKGTLSLFLQNTLKCVSCGREYSIHNGVPVMREFISDKLDVFLSTKVYGNQSRIKSLRGEGEYLRQSRIFYDFLPGFVTKFNIRGPCLDLGCGIGIFAERVPEYVGLDYSVDALLAEGFETFSRVCASGDLLPFKDSCFELIFSLNTLEHVPELDKAFEELTASFIVEAIWYLNQPGIACSIHAMGSLI